MGTNAVIADATSGRVGECTVAFFIDAKRQARHTKLFNRSGMANVMPLILRMQNGFVHRCARSL